MAWEGVLRIIGALVVIVLCALPGLFAGWPGLAPGWFAGELGGVPLSVVAMVASMAAFVVLAALCSAAARNGQIVDRGGE